MRSDLCVFLLPHSVTDHLLTAPLPPPRPQLVNSCLVAVALLEGCSARAACSHLLRERGEAVLTALRTDAVEDSVQRQVARATRLLLHTLQLVMALFCGRWGRLAVVAGAGDVLHDWCRNWCEGIEFYVADIHGTSVLTFPCNFVLSSAIFGFGAYGHLTDQSELFFSYNKIKNCEHNLPLVMTLSFNVLLPCTPSIRLSFSRQ